MTTKNQDTVLKTGAAVLMLLAARHPKMAEDVALALLKSASKAASCTETTGKTEQRNDDFLSKVEIAQEQSVSIAADSAKYNRTNNGKCANPNYLGRIYLFFFRRKIGREKGRR